ncbi:chemotaxis protein [Actinoplanes ianthinogenes]|uniref:Chemotaxis protein n=1 Tax=Actinoplanes ianthinogenes TaxID=122358 RepID=A0ABN6CPA4_9ACTN|nr:methyl-accepting chemotaxis protein [Actinoplanes ianthinogenes]BCJ47067.1 chemotaxis protein [Actinoplanes ianthinogenes]GGR13519.1 chemotaxis protein [Actinoplanes ianthinogenes]
MRFLTHFKIGARLGIAFTGVCLCMFAAVGVGLWGGRTARAATGDLAAADEVSQAALVAKFRTADFAGWQTGYAFDTIRGVAGATDDTVGQRKEFLASTAAFHDDLARLDAAPLAPAEQALVDGIEQSFDRFMAVDQRIIAGYRTGTRAGIAQANELASGESLDWMGKIVGSVDQLVELTSRRAQAAQDTADDAAATAQRFMVIAGLLCLVLTVLVAIVVTRSITRPLAGTVAALKTVADKDLTVRVPDEARDELGSMGRAMNRTLDVLRAAFASLNENSHTLAAAATELTATSALISDAAATASGQSDLVASSAEEVTRSVQTVAAGTEEMTAAIREISDSAARAAGVAATGVDSVHAAGETISRLGRSSAEISGVVNLITTIAEQTNLLALNATIEAARAGELGKGFAVVAGEVKDLAQATARATVDIDGRVQAIQADTDAAIDAINRIAAIITEVNEHSTTIAAAVEEQTATTAEMSRNVVEAATGSGQIAAGITGVATAAQDTAHGVTESRQTAEQLSRMSHELEALVGQFRL